MDLLFRLHKKTDLGHKMKFLIGRKLKILKIKNVKRQFLCAVNTSLSILGAYQTRKFVKIRTRNLKGFIKLPTNGTHITH